MDRNKYIRSGILREIRENHPTLESIIIQEKDRIIMEEYFRGSQRTLRLTASMEKSLLLATTAGILLQKGLIPDLSISLGEIFPDELDNAVSSPFAPVTLEHILTNSTGIKWPGPDEDGPSLRMISALKELKLSHPPGHKSIYKPDSFIIVWVTEKLTGRPFGDFLDEELFAPLGITDYNLSLYEKRGPRLSLTSRDILKIGRLYRAEGIWEKRRIFTESFTKAAHTVYHEPGFPESAGYGYLWWVGRIAGCHAPFAAGMGGQYLCLIPERDIIFLTTGSLPGQPGNSHRTLFRRFFELEKMYEQEGACMKKTPLTLDRERRNVMVEKLISYIDDEWEQEIGLLKAELLLDFLMETMGAELYNKGIADSRDFLLKKMEDMELDMDQLRL